MFYGKETVVVLLLERQWQEPSKQGWGPSCYPRTLLCHLMRRKTRAQVLLGSSPATLWTLTTILSDGVMTSIVS